MAHRPGYPGGIPHGSHPGKYERSIAKEETDKYPVIIDTFRPLHLTIEARKIDDDSYPYSWMEDKKKVEADE